MVILLPFGPEDWPVLSEFQYPGMPEPDARNLIANFGAGTYQGRYSETLAVEAEGRIVGFVSLYEQEDGTVSEGIEIYPPYRRQGYARAALTALLQHAKAQGFQTVTAQVRQDNTASVALHQKLAFQVTGSFVNKRGKPVFTFAKTI